jgi:hypothetical protein
MHFWLSFWSHWSFLRYLWYHKCDVFLLLIPSYIDPDTTDLTIHVHTIPRTSCIVHPNFFPFCCIMFHIHVYWDCFKWYLIQIYIENNLESRWAWSPDWVALRDEVLSKEIVSLSLQQLILIYKISKHLLTYIFSSSS